MQPILEVSGLVTELATERGRVRALDGVSFEVPAEKTLCLVGESGCGKSLTALSILQLLPEGAAHVVGGSVRLSGQELLGLGPSRLREVRGRKAAMIFQEPMSSLNPVLPVGAQIAEVVAAHLGKSSADARAHAVEMLKQVGIPDPEQRTKSYPHQLSGGMRQRVMIAMALACGPELLIADEPTTALDVTIQAQILDLIRALQRERKMAVLLITHDLGLVSEYADDVAVMYAGRVVERGSAAEVLRAPRHPYTRALVSSVPRARNGGRRAPLATIRGTVPAPWEWPSGCRFRERCPRASELCAGEPPTLANGVACYHPELAA